MELKQTVLNTQDLNFWFLSDVGFYFGRLIKDLVIWFFYGQLDDRFVHGQLDNGFPSDDWTLGLFTDIWTWFVHWIIGPGFSGYRIGSWI